MIHDFKYHYILCLCLILFHDRPGSFQLIPLRRVELLKYPHYKRFSGDLEVSSKISVSWEKSNFNMNLWNDRVQCISTKWCKNEHVLYIYLYIPAIKCETFIEYTWICLIHVFHMLTIIFYYSNIHMYVEHTIYVCCKINSVFLLFSVKRK